MSFIFWHTSLCIIGFRSIHFNRTDSNAFFLYLSNTPCVYIQFPYPLISCWTSSLLYVFAIVNSATVKTGANVSFSVMLAPGYMPSSGIAGSYGSCFVLFCFVFLRILHTILHCGCINLHSHQPCKRFSFSQHSLQPLLFVHFWMMTILTTVRWYLIVVLICISLIMSGVRHLFMCLLAICMSSLRNISLGPLPNFLLGC